MASDSWSHLLLGCGVHGLPLFGQVTTEQRLTEAYRLEREGKAAPALTELKLLLDSKSLDSAGIGKAWNVLGLAFEDQGDFSASRHAFEQSIQAYEGVAHVARSMKDMSSENMLRERDLSRVRYVEAPLLRLLRA